MDLGRVCLSSLGIVAPFSLMRHLLALSFALHGLDRIARGARIFYYLVIRKTEEREDLPTGFVRILDKDTIRVTVRTRQSTSSRHISSDTLDP